MAQETPTFKLVLGKDKTNGTQKKSQENDAESDESFHGTIRSFSVLHDWWFLCSKAQDNDAARLPHLQHWTNGGHGLWITHHYCPTNAT